MEVCLKILAPRFSAGRNLKIDVASPLNQPVNTSMVLRMDHTSEKTDKDTLLFNLIAQPTTVSFTESMYDAPRKPTPLFIVHFDFLKDSPLVQALM
jgi:hypothetical protein